MKVNIDPQTEAEPKTDIQLQDEAVQKDNKNFAENEKKLKDEHELTLGLSSPVLEEPATARDLKQSLGGTYEERLREDKTILISFSHGQRPVVIFSGFWNGKLVLNAMNAISRAYRTQKHKAIRANATST